MFLKRRAPRIGERIVFMHIPKTGGTSVDWAMREAYRQSGCAGEPSIVRLRASTLARLVEVSGRSIVECRRVLLLYFLQCKQSRYISGHLGFCAQALRAHGDDWKFVTLIRNPIDRWFSFYFYNRYKASAHERIEEDLETYAYSERAKKPGRALLANFTDWTERESMGEPGKVEEAIANLEKFHLVGCLEQLECFVAGFERLTGARLQVPEKRTNPVSRKEQDALITDKIRQRVRDLCAGDLLVYEHALQKIRNESS